MQRIDSPSTARRRRGRLVALAAIAAIWLAGGSPAAAQLGPDEWYVRLIVQAGALEDRGNLFGLLDDSVDGPDFHDLEELPPFAPPWLTIVFPHPEWGDQAGNYTTDYREAQPGRGNSWDFVVDSDVPRQITLSWQGPADRLAGILARSTLENVETGETVQPVVGGTYTTTMVATEHRFNWRTDSECSVSQALVAGLWRMISLSCNAGSRDRVEDVLGDDLAPADYGSRWIVYSWDPVAQSYLALGLTDALEEGRSYWLKTLDAGMTAQVGDGLNGAMDIPLTADPAVGRFNLAGHPFDFEVCWADARVVDGGSVLTLDQADPLDGNGDRECSLTPPGANCVMSRQMYQWTGGSYATFDGETPGSEGSLLPLAGLWVQAFRPGIALRIPQTPGSGCTAEAGGAGEAGARRGWHVRLIASAGELRDAATVLGQLPGSRHGHDRHDLRELPPYASPYLTLVFPHPEWGQHAGDYATDFRPPSPGRSGDRWRFELRTSAPGQEVVLSWQGAPEHLAGMRLVDRSLGRVVRVRPGESYAFTPPGTRHVFEWISRSGR